MQLVAAVDIIKLLRKQVIGLLLLMLLGHGVLLQCKILYNLICINLLCHLLFYLCVP